MNRHLSFFSSLFLCTLLLNGCGKSAADRVTPSPAVTAKVRASATRPPATPTASPVHTSSEGLFIYYGHCFDLDEGVSPGSADPDCEFVLQPKTSQMLIDFIPAVQARFSSLDEFTRKPLEAQCRQSHSLNNSAQTIDPQNGGYLCYRTGLGRYGYLRFMNSASNGLNISFTTFEEPGVSSMAATATPVQVFSIGRDQEFHFGWYFDADQGASSKALIDGSDFAIRPVIGGGDNQINLQPVSPARFSAMSEFTEAPGIQDCQQAVYPANQQSRDALELPLPAYICFQSGEGRFGYLYLHTPQEGGLHIDWRTFTPIHELRPVETPTPSALLLENEEERIYFRSYFNLDEGSQTSEEATGSDMLLYPGPGGDPQHFMLVPLPPASFAFDEMLYAPPDAAACRLSPVYDSKPGQIDLLEGGNYLCYQTSEGYYGYLYLRQSDASSVTLDWHTFDSRGELQSPHAAATLAADAIAIQVPPAAQPIWQDSFDSDSGWQLDDENALFEFKNGSLSMTSLHNDNRDAGAYAPQKISEAYLEAVFHSGPLCTSLDHYGLLFGAGEGQSDSGYWFGISCNGRYTLQKREGQTYRTLIPWSENELLRRGSGQRNRLGVLMRDGELVLYANGVPLALKEELQFDGGRFGVYLGAVRSDFFQVDVEDIAYWMVGATESTPTPSP